MKFLKNLLIGVGILGFGALTAMEIPEKDIPQFISKLPKVFMGEWENKTNQDLEFTAGGMPLILKVVQKVNFNEQLQPSFANSSMGVSRIVYMASFNSVDNPRENAQIFGIYRISEQLFTASVRTQSPESKIVSEKSITLSGPAQVSDSSVVINGVLEGNNFEKSDVKIIKNIQPKSLREQSIKAAADKVIGKIMTLEQAKKLIPTDLHEELENYINQNK